MYSSNSFRKWTNALSQQFSNCTYKTFSTQQSYLPKSTNQSLADNYSIDKENTMSGYYHKQAQSLERRHKTFQQLSDVNSYQYLQQLDFIKYRHHPASNYCSQEMNVLKKKNKKGLNKKFEPTKQHCCQHITNVYPQPQSIVKEIQTVFVHPAPQIIRPIIQEVRPVIQQVQRLQHQSLQSSNKRITINYISPSKQPEFAINYSGINSNLKTSQPQHQIMRPVTQIQMEQRVRSVSPFKIIINSGKCQNASQVISQHEQTPRIVISTLKKGKYEKDNIPQQNIGIRRINQSIICQLGQSLKAQSGLKQSKNYKNQHQCAENESLQIFNKNQSNDKQIMFHTFKEIADKIKE